jgi:hypothetical protein
VWWPVSFWHAKKYEPVVDENIHHHILPPLDNGLQK